LSAHQAKEALKESGKGISPNAVAAELRKEARAWRNCFAAKKFSLTLTGWQTEINRKAKPARKILEHVSDVVGYYGERIPELVKHPGWKLTQVEIECFGYKWREEDAQPLEKAAAKERQAKAGPQRGRGAKASGGGNLPQAVKGKSRDKAAKATGKKARTLAKAEAVVKAAQAEPQI
jgi:hypothetical protein